MNIIHNHKKMFSVKEHMETKENTRKRQILSHDWRVSVFFIKTRFAKYLQIISFRDSKRFTLKFIKMTISRWSGRVAVVTGASAGIGAAIAVEFCKNGIITIGLARRVEKMEEIRKSLTPEQSKLFHAMKCDVSNESEIIKTFAEIEKKFGGVDILINNASIVPQKSLINPENSSDQQQVINTNVFGVVNCTREAVKSMRNKSEGQIVHINSVTGHFMAFRAEHPSIGIYYASKHAVTALAEQHRHEFIKEKLNIKVTVSGRFFDSREFTKLMIFLDSH
jgi:NADP+-dependent farnesol dehydrogenase